MIQAFLALFLLFLPAAAGAASPPLIVTLPSADSYSYWVQSSRGPIGTLPVNVVHKQIVPIMSPVTTGDHLFVLDAHTGEVASQKISQGLSGAPLPITLVMTDFQPVAASVPIASVPIAPSAVPVTPPPASGAARLLTGLFSLLLAAGVGWLLLHLVQTRGEPLRQLARRAGVDVADSEAPTSEEQARPAEPPVYASQRRVLEIIPEAALLLPKQTGLPVSSPRIGRGPELALTDIPALLGLQGLAAGSTFALTDGDVTIGRDGDNEIVLAENTVSRRHARLLRDGQGQFTLTDLGSANGVYINGTRVQRAILCTGDEIKIGDNYFRFQAARETE